MTNVTNALHLFLASRSRLMTGSLFIVSHGNQTKYHIISPQRHLHLHQMESGVFSTRFFAFDLRIAIWQVSSATDLFATDESESTSLDSIAPSDRTQEIELPAGQSVAKYHKYCKIPSQISQRPRQESAQVPDLVITNNQGSIHLCNPLTKRAVIMTQPIIKLTALSSLAILWAVETMCWVYLLTGYWGVVFGLLYYDGADIVGMGIWMEMGSYLARIATDRAQASFSTIEDVKFAHAASRPQGYQNKQIPSISQPDAPAPAIELNPTLATRVLNTCLLASPIDSSAQAQSQSQLHAARRTLVTASNGWLM
ncbi:hypothetical protein EYC84_000984 [Monilinia fructicola]|uniref:Uncharacterized protein n=1 Tax=Monilinia fructicola TaxID=38448 RepID=A0A5M9JNG4_MONFR|nr:hypothetical protein EYC84_000984 [Monilinia fructicola]